MKRWNVYFRIREGTKDIRMVIFAKDAHDAITEAVNNSDFSYDQVVRVQLSEKQEDD